ncbi:hypothetical protein [Dyella sp.]|uniref:HIT family protein n=1 Tax=Dyella sp. TaxID=1869338 RepID=UPI00283B1889|nr:hypothetical protein [Dyella sp.]MDR3447509.1 hypothetical protein [Dyella sp.]
MQSYLIYETAHWLVSHRRDARYPGYLMISSRSRCADLYELDKESLEELGPVLKRTELLLRSTYSPHKVVFYKLGFSPGFNCHFHVAPITEALMEEIRAHPAYADEPDGNDAILFLSRIYCERDLADAENREMELTIDQLRDMAVRLA